MKKSTLIGLSILSVFLLCSLSYQPIIAEQPIIKPKENVILVESKDCGCSSKPIWNFPIICAILYVLQVFSLSISIFPVPPLWMLAQLLAEILDCPLTYP